MKDKALVFMFRDISQLTALGCKVVSRTRNAFGAELIVRDGKYKLRIDYTKGRKPKVFVISPEIDMRNSVEIHTFGAKYHNYYKRKIPELCLTYYEEDKWDISMPIIKTFVPWAVEWTEFYELWLLTGKWFGKGVHPQMEKKDD